MIGKKLCSSEMSRYVIKNGASIGVPINRLNFAHRYLMGVIKISVTVKQKM